MPSLIEVGLPNLSRFLFYACSNVPLLDRAPLSNLLSTVDLHQGAEDDVMI